MPAFTEANQSAAVRKKIPLREAFVEAFPELTPALTLIPKHGGKRTVSETSSEVQWPFKNFRSAKRNASFGSDDVNFDTESEDNEANKTMLKGRIQLFRGAVKTGRIAQSVISQHGGVNASSGNKGGIHMDHVKDMLRGLRTDKNWHILSTAHSKAEASVGGVKVPYMTRAFGGWMQPGVTHADLPIDALAAIPSGNVKEVSSAAAFTEDHLNTMMTSAWNARRSAGNWKMFNASDMQLQLNTFVQFGELTSSKHPIRRVDMGKSPSTIELHVRFYKGSFGTVESIPVVDLPEVATMNGTTTNTDATITGLSSTARLLPGMKVTGTGIPADTRILYIVSATSVELDKNATASATVALTFGETVYSEMMDMEFIEFDYVDEVAWTPLEDAGGGPRGYADSLSFLAPTNPQAHMMIKKS